MLIVCNSVFLPIRELFYALIYLENKTLKPVLEFGIYPHFWPISPETDGKTAWFRAPVL